MELTEFERWWAEYQDTRKKVIDNNLDKKLAEDAWVAAMYTAFSFDHINQIAVELGLFE